MLKNNVARGNSLYPGRRYEVKLKKINGPVRDRHVEQVLEQFPSLPKPLKGATIEVFEHDTYADFAQTGTASNNAITFIPVGDGVYLVIVNSFSEDIAAGVYSAVSLGLMPYGSPRYFEDEEVEFEMEQAQFWIVIPDTEWQGSIQIRGTMDLNEMNTSLLQMILSMETRPKRIWLSKEDS